jgi:hypothetical protein
MKGKRGEVVALAGDQAHAGGILARQEPETTVLDLVNP